MATHRACVVKEAFIKQIWLVLLTHIIVDICCCSCCCSMFTVTVSVCALDFHHLRAPNTVTCWTERTTSETEPGLAQSQKQNQVWSRLRNWTRSLVLKLSCRTCSDLHRNHSISELGPVQISCRASPGLQRHSAGGALTSVCVGAVSGSFPGLAQSQNEKTLHRHETISWPQNPKS